MARSRKKPYTKIGIKRKKCFRCGNPATFQWQICADNNIYRPICMDCDIALNSLVLRWMSDPEHDIKMDLYKKRLETNYGYKDVSVKE